MRKLEKISGLLLIFGLILKFFLIPGGNPIRFLSFFTLIMFYFYLGFALFNDLKFKQIFISSSYINISKNKILGGIVTGITLAIILTGLMFKSMHWPGQRLNIVIGLLFDIVIIIIIVAKTSGDLDLYYKKILIRLIIVGFFGFLMLFISDSAIIKIQYRNYPRYINAFNEFEKYPNNKNLIDSLDKEKGRIFMSEEEFLHYYKEKK